MGKIDEAARVFLGQAGRSGVQIIADNALHLLRSVKQVETITCTAGLVAAVKQVETIEVTEGAVTAAGDITMTITSSGMGSSPKAVVVPIGDGDSVDEVATLLRTHLGDDADVAAFFTVGGTGEFVTLTPLAFAANDATLAFGFVDTDTTGVTCGASTNTTAGVADVSGDITMTITSSGMLGSPEDTVVALAEGDTIAEVVVKLKAALNANNTITSYFVIGGASTTVTLTPKLGVANDATLAFGFVDTDTTGSTFGASTNTTAGAGRDSGYEETDVITKIKVITATTFAVLTAEDGFTVIGTMTGVAYPVNFEIVGRFVGIDLTSGSILAYKN